MDESRLGYMDRLKTVEVPLVPAQSQSVRIGASGQGAPTFENADGGPLAIEQITLSPFTCRIAYAKDEGTPETDPRIFFLMEDGTLRTQSQMMTTTSGAFESDQGKGVWDFRFFNVLDLDQLSALVVFGRAYPLDGGISYAYAVDPALSPFQVPQMAPLEEGRGFSIPVRALCEGLGGTCVWNGDNRSATLSYRGVTLVLTPGSKTALANGQPVALLEAPALQDGSLAASSGIFDEYWGIHTFVLRTRYDPKTETITYFDWVVLP